MLQNKTVLEVLETIDWTDAGNREAYQAAVDRGVHTVYCDVAAQNYPVSKLTYGYYVTITSLKIQSHRVKHISHGVFRTCTVVHVITINSKCIVCDWYP